MAIVKLEAILAEQDREAEERARVEEAAGKP